MNTKYLVRVVFGNGETQNFYLKEINLIGRSKDVDIIINDNSIGRHHCLISLKNNGELHFKDLGSQNGSSINGVKIIEAILPLNAFVKVGNCQLCIVENEYVEFRTGSYLIKK